MKEIDAKHMAYHVLAGLYFIWLPLFIMLHFMAYNNVMHQDNTALGRLLVMWLSLNLVIGTSLFFVLRLFGKRTMLAYVISYSYYIMAAVSVVALSLLFNRI